MEVGANDLGIDSGRQVIHNRYYTISGSKYWVEISFCKDLAFVILFSRHGNHAHQDEYLATVMPLRIANKLLQENHNESEVFVRRVRVVNG